MRVLVIDDDENECRLLSDFIQNAGHEVTLCYDGEEAVKKISGYNFDLVVSDVKLPKRNGIELAEFIKQKKTGMEIILVSGIDDVIKSINAIELGILDFLTKPVDINKLAALLEKTVEKLSGKNDSAEITLGEDTFIKIDDYKISRDYSLHNDYIGKIGIFSEKMISIYRKLKKLEEYRQIPVLIEGETGTGKEIIARYIHFENKYNRGEFVAINCSNLKNELFDSEIFGYDRGAFTGADMKGKEGKIKLAENGTLFLDEITELSTDHQAKLLRLIQEREYYRIGSTKKEEVNARIVVSTNRDVKKLVSENLFREDLYYRLNICKVTIPPLRERKEEIIPLTIFLVRSICDELGKKIEAIESSALKLLKNNDWRGNVRELKNLIMKSILFNEGNVLTKKSFQSLLSQEAGLTNPVKGNLTDFEIPEEAFNLDEFTLNIVKKTLEKFNGNKSRTAKFLGLTRTQLYGRYKI